MKHFDGPFQWREDQVIPSGMILPGASGMAEWNPQSCTVWLFLVFFWKGQTNLLKSLTALTDVSGNSRDFMSSRFSIV
jgi:hypothetical protein